MLTALADERGLIPSSRRQLLPHQADVLKLDPPRRPIAAGGAAEQFVGRRLAGSILKALEFSGQLRRARHIVRRSHEFSQRQRMDSQLSDASCRDR